MGHFETVRLSIDSRGIARITLARPHVRNALSGELIDELTHAVAAANDDPSVRGIVLAGEGKVFCAGADLNWMRTVHGATEKEVANDSRRLQTLYRTVDESPKATLCRVHGGAYAGALGLLSACDIVLSTDDARFSVSEVRLGLTPSILSAFLLPRIGPGWFRYLATTGGVFDAETAQRAGLVHEIVDSLDALDERVEQHVQRMLAASPEALRKCKALVAVASGTDREQVFRATLERNVASRFSPEGQDGMNAFLEGRKPGWNPD